MLKCIGIAFLLFAAVAFIYEVWLCSKIEKQLDRIEKLAEGIDDDAR